MNYIISASTDIGNTKSTNQDSFGARVITTPKGKMAFAVLCDGMGGLEKGEVASATVVNAFLRWASERLPVLCETGLTDAAIREDWTRVVTEYNEKIQHYGKSLGVRLGTTVTAMLLTDQRFFILNVGDSRAYEIHHQLRVLTKDQTVVAREVEMGLLTPEQARTDPRRSVLLQCIGASDAVYPDLFFGDTKKDAVYMLCSDGFRHEISEEEIFASLQPSQMLSAEGMKANMDALIALDKQRQERDNISVLSVRTF